MKKELMVASLWKVKVGIRKRWYIVLIHVEGHESKEASRASKVVLMCRENFGGGRREC